MTDEQIAEYAAEKVAINVKKDAENTVKQHINTIWNTIESWTIEKLSALIADLQKHV